MVDGAVVVDGAGERAAGDGAVVVDGAGERAVFNGAAGMDGHGAIEHSPARACACNGAGTVLVISEYHIAVDRTAVGVKIPISRPSAAGDV